jgi:integrase
MARTLTDKGVAALKPRDKQFTCPDPLLRGHYIRVSPGGSKQFVAVARGPNGKQVWTTIGSVELFGIDEARDKAREVIKRIKGGQDRAGPQSFEAVSADWLHRHVDAKGLRIAADIRRILRKYMVPAWGGREFAGIRRGDVTALLDKVEDMSGARTADKVLEVMSGISHWYERRNEDYTSPIVRGMKRYSIKEHARDRVLTDDEIRTLWTAAKTANGYGALLQLLLLTGQRLAKVVTMRWQDVAADGTWTIPAEAREKTNAKQLVLPKMALDIIRARPKFESNPYVLAGAKYGAHLCTAYPKSRGLRAAIGFENFRLHDLRRTAKTLMVRAGVAPHISERVLGHVINGVEGTYDRHGYREEKAHALRALADLVESIVHGDTDRKVRRLRG